RPSGRGERETDSQRWQERTEGILRQGSHTEGREPGGRQPAPPFRRAAQEQRETDTKRREKYRLRAHIATIGEETARSEQRDAGEPSPRRADQPRAEPGGRPNGDEGAERGDGAGTRLTRASDGEGSGKQHVQERRLVDVPHAVQRQPERIAAGG